MARVNPPIPSTNTGLYFQDDDYASDIPIGFTFNYYGTDYTNIDSISTNGSLNFDQYTSAYPAVDLTSNAGIGDSIYPLWSDNEVQTGSISYTTIGTAPNREFICQWTEVSFDDVDSWDMPTNTYFVILYEGTNKIQMQYRYCFGGDFVGKGGQSGVGIGTSGAGTNVQFSFNTASLYDGLAISFTPSGPGTYAMDSAAIYEPLTLQPSDVPDPPTLLNPSADAYDVPLEPVLSWTAMPGADFYNVWVSSDPTFPFDEGNGDPAAAVVVVQEDLSGASFDMTGTPLTPNTRYYWFVQAVTTNAGGTISDFGTFYTGPNPNPPVVPVLPYTGR
jgi:hypothetical protein